MNFTLLLEATYFVFQLESSGWNRVRIRIRHIRCRFLIRSIEANSTSTTYKSNCYGCGTLPILGFGFGFGLMWNWNWNFH